MRLRPAPALLAAIVLVGCVTSPSPTPTALSTPTLEPTTATPAASPTTEPTVTPTPEPSLSLDLPEARDPRTIALSVALEVATDGGGRIVVTVTSLTDARIDELVLRWPTDLADTLFLAPFQPSDERIRDGGPPLVQPWTKWVVGPGEQGEPAGTTSLGWGPLLPGATLEIPILVTRVAPGPVAFDLQVLARNDLLTLDDGSPAELRVEVPG